jgi:hypothetical protein
MEIGMTSTDPTAPALGGIGESATPVAPPGIDAPEATPLEPNVGTQDTPADGSETSATGVAELAQQTQAPQSRAKTKGVADIVFVVDISGSMAPCIDALRQNIETFVNTLNSGR